MTDLCTFYDKCTKYSTMMKHVTLPRYVNSLDKTPLLPLTVVVFVTCCQWFVNGLENNGEKQHYILEIIEIC